MVYVIDDDKSIVKALVRLFDSADLESQAFTSAKTFLKEVKPTARDCLIVDVQMPEMTGPEMVRALLNLNIQVPVIFITAYDDDNTRQVAKDLGAVGYFRKPFDDQALLDTIHFAVINATNASNPIEIHPVK